MPKLRFLTSNFAFLPHHLEFNNNTLLAPNLDRAKALAKQLLDKNYDFVCLQEVWDTRVVAQLKELLKEQYPEISIGVNDEVLTYPNLFIARKLQGKDAELYKDESLAEQLKIHLNRSGLMFIGKLKILEKKSRSFTNDMVGEELMGQKGYTAYKLLVGDHQVITVAFSHLHAGGAIWKDASTWYGGTTSHRRGEQHRMIHDDLIKSGWFAKMPEGKEFLDMFFLGDVNASVDNERECLTISGGKSAANHFDQDEVKYDGQFEHMREYEPIFPSNAMSIRELIAKERGAKKQVLPEKLKEAEEKHLQTGTDLANTPARRMIDIATMKKNPKNQHGEFKTFVVNFSNPELGNLSDHNGIECEYDTSAPRKEYKDEYADYVLVPTDKWDPSAGIVDKLFHPKKILKCMPQKAVVEAIKQDDSWLVTKLMVNFFGLFSRGKIEPMPERNDLAPLSKP